MRAQLSETGFVDAPAKYLPQMAVDGKMTYGQLFSVAKEGPYQFRVFVKLPGSTSGNRVRDFGVFTSRPRP